MAFQAFRPFDALRPFRSPVGGDGKIRQPVALEAPALEAGTYFVNALGELLVHGTKRVEPQE